MVLSTFTFLLMLSWNWYTDTLHRALEAVPRWVECASSVTWVNYVGLPCHWCFTVLHVCFQALSVGIFPYVLKLLQSSARELRPLLVFIWAKLLAVDSVRNDLAVSIRATFSFYIFYKLIRPNSCIGVRCVLVIYCSWSWFAWLIDWVKVVCPTRH